MPLVRYFVVFADGQRFGPADIPLLNQWSQEGRVLPDTILEEEGTGRRMQAAQVPGLALSTPSYSSPGPQGGPAYQGYYRGGAMGAQQEGQTEYVVSLVMSGISFLLCFACPFLAWITPAVALYLAGVAMKKGHTNAMSARIFALVTLVIFGLVGIGYCALFGIVGIGGAFG